MLFAAFHKARAIIIASLLSAAAVYHRLVTARLNMRLAQEGE